MGQSGKSKVMPQLDKLSFATQYFWLTLFFFALYFLTVNFFVVLVFKNLKLRNIIYKIWYFFLYKFDYVEYSNKNKSLTNASFGSLYFVLYANFFLLVKSKLMVEKATTILNKSFLLQNSLNSIHNSYLSNSLLQAQVSPLIKEVKNLSIDEI